MRLLRFPLALLPLATGCILLSCQGMQSHSAPSNAASSQILYVIGNGTISTYAVDKNTLRFTSLGQPVNLIPTGSLVQFIPSPMMTFYTCCGPMPGTSNTFLCTRSRRAFALSI
jgi:hypothetical protein